LRIALPDAYALDIFVQFIHFALGVSKINSSARLLL
jgi:hypothetical protein